MPSENFIKNITSKDINLSINTIKNLIKSANLEDFKELCDKADFIFPFLKERIIKDFVKIINKNDLAVIFKFSKIYSNDFEDLIVKSWLKFACEDLTDEIVDLFENGTKEQKAYASKYFSFINDLIALEYLNKYALDEYLPLKINCAKALASFKDENILNEAKEIVINSNDDFEKMSAFEFINAYGGDNSIKFVVQHMFKSPFLNNIIVDLLDYNELDKLKNILNENELLYIFNELINGYPEDITLDTIQYYQIYDWIELIETYNNQYCQNLLALAKNKFNEFLNNDIYLFDLDKNTKEELKNIVQKLNSCKLNFDNIQQEFELEDEFLNRFECALDVVLNYKLIENCEFISKLINNNKLENKLLIKSMEILKELNQINLVDKKIVENIENKDIRAIVESIL